MPTVDAKLKNLIARIMNLPPEGRQQIAQLLAESFRVHEVRDSGVPYGVSKDLPEELIGMTPVTVVLPDDLAKQAQAAGLLAEKSLEELIRRALEEQKTNSDSNEGATRRRRRLVSRNGRLVVEALPGERSISDTEIRDLLNKMEW